MTAPAVPPLTSAQKALVTARTAQLAVAAACVLIAIKGWAWLASGSVAMLASLTDSVLDLAASLFSYFAVRYAANPPDDNHRFGHGKAEAFAGLFQAGLVAVSATLIAVEAVARLVRPQALQAGMESIGVMLVSMLVTAALVLAQSRALKKTGSVATAGDRAHYAADFASNLVVILGLAAGALFGLTWADAAAGVFVALWLGHGAWEVARDSANHLMDHELPETDRARIKALAEEDPAMGRIHDLRTRASGPYLHIQFHADLDPDQTLEQAHAVIVAAEARIRTAYPAADIIIHPDPADRAEPHGHEAFAG
ncbi:MAG: cation diffusion facilitator family transporter [Alphaproteobacteria bacterium]|nr:cation diffusion facilitator family transporter [Alphaproteobacteria bacterium]